ncbi:MAG: hypothetical protein U0R19_24475 [Bryobacteraceae bacterium]
MDCLSGSFDELGCGLFEESDAGGGHIRGRPLCRRGGDRRRVGEGIRGGSIQEQRDALVIEAEEESCRLLTLMPGGFDLAQLKACRSRRKNSQQADHGG